MGREVLGVGREGGSSREGVPRLIGIWKGGIGNSDLIRNVLGGPMPYLDRGGNLLPFWGGQNNGTIVSPGA